jgi:hypothetical protein
MRLNNLASIMVACCGLASVASTASAQVVFSQIYGGGGNAGAAVHADYVELKNNSLAPVDIGGWSVQYASAGGSFTNRFNIPSSTIIPANGFFTIRLGNPGTNGAAPTLGFDLVNDGLNPSITGSIAASSSGGKFALVTDQVNITTNCTASTVVDLVGWGGTGVTVSCSETSPAGGTGNTTGLVRRSNGCTDTNNNFLDFQVVTITVDTPRNSTVTAPCPTATDCNANGVLDTLEIAANPALDCNVNGRLDECDISGGFFGDCDNNGTPDVCQITADPSIDCNNNGILDGCESVVGLSLDVNGADSDDDNRVDFVLNNTEPDPALWRAGGAIGNGPLDLECENAAVAEAAQVATVQPAGIRGGGNGTNFWNIEGFNFGQFQSYGGTRFDIAAAVASFDTRFGAGNWSLSNAYLVLQQSNAGFTSNGAVEIYWTNNDAQDFTVLDTPNTNTIYGNFASDFADRELVTGYTFYRGSRLGGEGSGTVEAFKIFDAADTTPSTGQANIGTEINSASGQLTLVLLAPDFTGDTTAATYAGTTNSAWRGPTLVLFANASGGPSCDYDFNQDENVDLLDAQQMAQVFVGLLTPESNWLDGDLNGDENADLTDAQILAAFVVSGNCAL